MLLSKKIIPCLSLTLLVGCSFGSKDSDPMSGKEPVEYNSVEEARSKENQWEKKFSEETQKYQNSVAEMQTQLTRVEKKYISDIEKHNADIRNKEQSWLKNRQAMEDEFTTFRNSISKNKALYEENIASFQKQLNLCRNEINDFKPQEFEGLLHNFNLESHQEGFHTRSVEWSAGEEKSYSGHFSLAFETKAFAKLDIRPAKGEKSRALPSGLKFHWSEKNPNEFQILGTPSFKLPFENGIFRGHFEIYPVFKPELEANPRKVAIIGSRSFVEPIDIVVFASKHKPKIVEVKWSHLLEEAPILEIFIQDIPGKEIESVESLSEGLTKVEGLNKPPVLQFSNPKISSNKIIGLNAAALLTQNINKKLNPEYLEDKGLWVFSYQFHKSLALLRYADLIGKQSGPGGDITDILASFEVRALSSLSGLFSEPVTKDISIKGAFHEKE